MATAGVPVAVAGKGLKGPRACATCARAKSRCISGPAGQEKCERCHRLRKACSSQTPAPPRKRKEPKPTRVAELERRLEDLTARIESVQRLGPPALTPPDSDHISLPPPCPLGASEDRLPPRHFSCTDVPVPTFGRDRWDSPFGHIFPERSIFEVQPEHQQPTVSNKHGGATEATSPSAPPGLIPTRTTTAGSNISSPYQHPSSGLPQQQQVPPWPQGDEAEAMLDEYRNNMGHLFPFAVVPPYLSATQMREHRPFFWKAVMMMACLFDGPRQVALGNELLREISEAAFIKPQKNLDLLQGLQMLIAWYHYNLNSFQMINLLFLARSITTSLRATELKTLEDGKYASESLEHMRAFAGTYYLVTITFTTNKRPDALMNTSYLATCCLALHNQMEYATDELVVHLVRAQQLSQSISQAFARRKATPGENQIPQAAFIQGLLERIRGFASALPPHIRANVSLAGHLHVVEVLVYENSLSELSYGPFATQHCEQDPMAVSIAQPDPERIEMLWKCTHAVQGFMANRLSREKGEYPRFICLSSFDTTYVFLTMLKLVTLQVPGWDLGRAREELRFDYVVSQLIEHMELTAERRKRKRKGGVASGQSNNRNSLGQSNEMYVPGHGEVGGTEDPWTKLARKLRTVKDHLLTNGFGNDFTSSQIARVCDPAPMTLADATQDLMQDLGAGLWQDVTSGMSEWTSVLVGDPVDWATMFGSYGVPESGFTM
ncbi:protein priB [Achaetomium macrosporum]|uniref:Protein priB n=1 Tax=Achaetomium macrosporum TaxID=79813 RepID=A0AAN7HHS8_9PEZI|nr:protein priB [Achaetomium macrosporum]